MGRRRRWTTPLATAILMAAFSAAFGVLNSRSPIDCDFDGRIGANGMCSWRPDNEGRDLWRTGNAVLVDSVNSVIKSGDGTDRFAYVQGHYGTTTAGALESQILRTAPGIANELQFSFWKAAFGPMLDICVRRLAAADTDALDCIDTVAGVGEQRWTERTLAVPPLDEPFRIVFRARNIHSAEDLIAIDDIRLRMVDADRQLDSKAAEISPKAHFNSFEMRRSQTPRSPLIASSSAIIQPIRGVPPVQLDEERLPIQDDDEELTPKRSRGRGLGLSEQIQNAPAPTPATPLRSIVRPATEMMNSGSTPTTTPIPSPPLLSLHQSSPIPRHSMAFPDFPSFDGSSNSISAPKAAKTSEPTEICRAVKCSFLDSACLWTLGQKWKRGEGNVAMEVSGEDVIRTAYFKAPFAAFLEFDLWMSDDADLFVSQETHELGVPGADELALFTRHGMANNGWHRFRVPLRPHFNPIRLTVRTALPNGAFVTLSNTRLVGATGDEMGCDSMVGVPQSVAAAVIQPPWASGVPIEGKPPMSTLGAAPSLRSSPFIPLPTTEMMRDSMQPMGSDGITPIVPSRDSTHRLTAFQRPTTDPPLFPTLAPLITAPPPSFDLFPTMPMLFAPPPPSTLASHQYVESTTPADPFGNTDADLMRNSPTLSPEPIVRVRTESPKALTEAVYEAMDPPTDSPTYRQPIVPNAEAGIEKQLRQMAADVGLDVRAVPSGSQIIALKKALGQRLFNNRPLPLSVGSAIRDGDENLKPIRPMNVNDEDFERALKQESLRRLVPSNAAAGDMVKRLAALLNLPPPSHDQSALTRENLDFVFQNSLNG